MKRIIFVAIGIAVLITCIGWINDYYNNKEDQYVPDYYPSDSDSESTKPDDYELSGEEKDYREDYYNPYPSGESRGTYDDPYRHDSAPALDSYDYGDR